MDSIGSAEMGRDGVLTLRLRAEGAGFVGDATFTYRPDEPMYQIVVAHLGGISPGEEKLVPPFPPE